MSKRMRQLGWFVALWSAGVLVVASLAYAIRSVLL